MKLITVVLFALMGCASIAPAGARSNPLRSVHFDPTPGPHIRIEKISNHVWLHESSHEISGYGRISANGIIVVGSRGAMVIDSSWTEKQTAWLLERVHAATGTAAIALVPTHSHDDRAGGIGIAARMGVATHALDKTNELLRRNNKPTAVTSFAGERLFELGGVSVEVFYPGAGHTVDNAVVYVREDRLLFGGCLIRSARSKGLGYTEEADIRAWPGTVERIIERYPAVQIVVPGHGPSGDSALLTHTVELAKRGR